MESVQENLFLTGALQIVSAELTFPMMGACIRQWPPRERFVTLTTTCGRKLI
jgi:hypothetical protein